MGPITLSPDDVEEFPTLDASEVEEAPSRQQATASLESVTRPQSPASNTPSSANLSLGPVPPKRSTPEGLVTEQQERREGMPLEIQPANYGLDAARMRPEGIQPVPRPNVSLANPTAPTIDTTQSPNAPFTPEEQAARHQQKQSDDAATSSMPANYNRMLDTGRRIGTAVGENAAAFATPSPQPGGYGVLNDQSRGNFEQEHPAAAGVGRAVGAFTGQMAADPVTYLFAGSSELASPLLDKIISSGFRIGLGVGAVRAARDLQQNWDKYTPEKRYEVATEAGLSGFLAVGAKQIRDVLKEPYNALPAEFTARAEGVFRNLVYKAGGTLPEKPTIEQATAAFRAAMNNLHPDINPTAAEDAKNLNAAWSALKQAGRFGGSAGGPTVPQPTRAEIAHYLQRAGGDPDLARELHKSDFIAPPTEVGKLPEQVKTAVSAPDTLKALTPKSVKPSVTSHSEESVRNVVQPEKPPATAAGAKGLGFQEAFGSAKDAATDSFVDSAWQRLQAGKTVLFADKKGSLEGRIQAEADAGNVKSRGDVARIVDAWKLSRGTPKKSTPGPTIELNANEVEEAAPSRPVDSASRSNSAGDLSVAPTAATPMSPLAKGSKVTLPDGRRASVEYFSPSDKLPVVRLKAEDGETVKLTRQKDLDALKPATKYKFGSTQANIPEGSDAHTALETARGRISKSDLAGKGTDIDGNHVTVRYGIKSDDIEGVKKYLASVAPFEASLGKTDKFPPSEHSDGAAVIHAPIESPELQKINAELEKHGEFTEPSFNEYKPHATIAYVDPAKADRYVGMSVTQGKKFPVKEIAITDKNGGQQVVKLAGRSVQPERRADLAERKRVSEMSHEEMQKELLLSKITDLPNRRAFEEAERTPANAVAMSDADGLKALNDKFGYEAGNELLRAKAESLKEAGLESYHDKGDEFLYRGENLETLRSKLEKARELLRNRIIQAMTPDGKVEYFKGADFSYGHGKDLAAAEAGLKSHKAKREATGERARGELRNIRRVTPAELAKGNSIESPAQEVKPTVSRVDTNAKIEPEAVRESTTPSPTPFTEGGRKVPAASPRGGTELAREQPRTGEVARTEGSSSASSGERGRIDNRSAPAVREAGPGAGPGERTGLSEPAASERGRGRRTERVAKNHDWFGHSEDFSVDATPSVRLEWNIRALTILKNVLERGQKLTDEDRDALAHYVGWGALDKAFNPGYGGDSDMWHRAGRKLQELMSPEELAAARRSTQNAHYTSPQIVRWVWSVLSRMGFKGGVILEPSMGTGNFLGMMPRGMRRISQAIGNELDPTTYNIAKLLYPSATTFNKDFVDLMMPNDSVDLAVSNVPFGVQVYDPVYRKLGKPAIHDYFFVKTLDKVRPGGVVAFITSTYTLDKQSSAIRDVLADKADLLFAARLPQDTFDKSSGTAVSTDLILLRKRAPGAKPAGEPFGGLRDVAAKYEPYFYDKAGKTAIKQINEYYAAHQENVLGELVIGRGRTSANPEMLVAKRTEDFEERLSRALGRVPRDTFEGKAKAAPVLGANLDEQFAPDSLQEGNYALDDKGVVRQRVNGRLVATEVNREKDGRLSLAVNERMKQLIGIRDGLKGLMLQMRTLPDDTVSNREIAQAQTKLAKQIEGYRKRHGWFSEKRTKDVFYEDPHYPLLLSLEDYDKTQKVGTPADILSKRTIYPEAKLTTLSADPKEAFYQVLGERGRPDLDFMAGLSGKTVDEIAKPLVEQGLVFKEPNTHEWQVRSKYLSGYVRDKLADAKKAVEQGQKEFEANVRELEKVQPATVPINSGDPDKDIQVKLGATWVSGKVVEQFAKEVLGSGHYASVRSAAGQWKVDGLGQSAEMVQYGGGGMPASELLELALNLRQPVVKETYRDEHGNTREVVNQDKTIAAKKAQQKLKEEFAKWARNHKTIGPHLEKTYNETVNNLVEPAHDGSHLTFPGMNRSVLRGGTLQPHQSDAVWRIVQDGRALLAHVVGAGKTYEMIAAAMEMKRLGMIRKPMFAVPNHLVGQWAKDFLKLYPGAKILVPEKKDFESVRRNRIMSKIATGDWDAIILPHSQFNLMDISPEYQQKTLNKELDELEETYMAAKAAGEGKKSFTVKRLEKARDRLRSRLAELKDAKADKTVRFDDLGVDHLFIDEAHAYKNLAFYTKMERVAGLAQGDSKRAIRLKMKTDYLLEKHDNRGVVFATGTPIQNTMAEMYNMIKYIAPDALEKAGIKYFDDWAANFGEVITAMELGVDGRSYKPRSKFARFTNVPELQQMFRSFADVKTNEDLNLPIPKIEGGMPQPLTARPTPELEDYVKQLIERAKRCRGEGGSRPDPSVDNMLKVTGDGRKAATDMRLIDPNYPDDPQSKINTVVNKAFEEWESGKADKLTQAIFLDNYQYLEDVGAIHDEAGKVTKKGMETALLNLYRDMADKLVARGVPKSEIAIIHDYDKQEQKTELFRKMNAGEVRVLFGSTEKMGAGMNAQQRMKSLIDVDSPWRPGDIEQRHGRILRQGNMNDTVRIYHAVTKGTFDSYMIQTLKGKAEFINQVMSGKFKGRTMTDAAGDMVLSLEEMLAASSNNPDVKKQMELSAEVATLQALEREHEANMYRNRRNAESDRDNAARRETEAALWKKVQADWSKATAGDKFSFNLLGKKFTDYKDAADWIKDQDAPPMPFYFDLNGIPMRFYLDQTTAKGEPPRMFYAMGNDIRHIDHFPSLLASTYGYLNPKNVQSRLDNAEKEFQRLSEKAEKLEALARKSGFEDADRLKKAKEELETVKKRLGLSDDKAAQEQDVAAAVDGTPDQPEPGEEEESEKPESLLVGESGSFTPAALNPARIETLYKQFIDKAINKKLDIGDKYQRVSDHDPVIASALHEKDNAPRHFQDKAESNVNQVIKGLSEEQVRLTAMMADSDAREYLEENHPDQYQQALDDPAVVKAVQAFKRYQDELAAVRISLGWHVRRDMSIFEDEEGKWKILDRDGNEVEGEEFKTAKAAQQYVEENGKILDHLKRTYPEHKNEPLMGRVDEGPSLGASYGGIKPPRPDKKQRIATAEYFYQHGAKDFSGYLKSFTQAYHAALNQRIYDSLTEEATPWKQGTAQPPQIEYRGKTYYSPEVAKSMKLAKPENRPKQILEYRAYDPAKDDRALIRDFENGWSTQTTGRPGIGPLDRWLAPAQVVDALEHYDMTRGVKENDSIRRFFQDQIVGLFGPTIHVLNIMRRLSHVVGTGPWDPRVWPYYQKLFFSQELRDRLAQGLADDAIDHLSKWGSYTNARDIGSLHAYVLGNLNPANWARQTIGKFSKGVLFDPKFMGGRGGLDQKARVLAYDYYTKKQGFGDQEASARVEDDFGRYAKQNWTERMFRWARALLFPGWDFSSLTHFLRMPLKAALYPAVATMVANIGLNMLGKNKDSDKYDFAYIHYGDRKFRSSLITESMAMHIAEPFLEAGKAALEGGGARDIASAAGQGVLRGGGGLAGNLRPEIQAAAELLSNRQYMGGTKEIWKPEDKNIPGKVLPTRQLDKMLAYTVVKTFPAVSRFLDSSYDNVDLATGAGSIIGITNYRSGAEERLKTNEAKAMGYSQMLSKLAETEPDAAEKLVQDPNKAVYLMFNKDFSELAKDLKDIDQQIERVRLSDLPSEERRSALASLKESRVQLLESADAIDKELTNAKLQMKKAQ